MTRRLTLWLATAFTLATTCFAQDSARTIIRGAEVFAKTCATGYCHGLAGGASGAPRLAGRGFDQPYIARVVTRGIPGTGMASFANRLPPQELIAVIGYVATLNGVANPDVAMPDTAELVPAGPKLTGDAARGKALFSEALRAFGRCSTCHQVSDLGIPVAAAIAKVPASAAELKALATPNIKTASLDGESMPVLVLSRGQQSTVFYDLTSAPPVQRTVESASLKIADGSAWRHSSATGAYSDAELEAILAYLRAVTNK